MNQSVSDIMRDLMNFYNKKLYPAMVLFYECSMEQFDEDLLCRSIVALKMNEPPTRFPTPATIRKYYLEEKDARWQKQKASEPSISRLRRIDIPASQESFNNFKIIFGAIGEMPKDEWLKLAVEYDMLKPSDVEPMKEAWQKMGAHPIHWRKKS